MIALSLRPVWFYRRRPCLKNMKTKQVGLSGRMEGDTRICVFSFDFQPQARAVSRHMLLPTVTPQDSAHVPWLCPFSDSVLLNRCLSRCKGCVSKIDPMSKARGKPAVMSRNPILPAYLCYGTSQGHRHCRFGLL